MHKRQYFGLLVLVLALLLCACAGRKILSSSTTPPTNAEPSAEATGNPTEAPVPSHAPTEPPTEATEPTQEETEPSLPPHSDLYLPEYTADQIFTYFEEVVLHVEYTDGEGNPALVQKWNAPIHYRTFGKPTEEDLAVLEALFAQLNEIPGFPGIYAADEDEPVDLFLFFLDPESFRAQFSEILNGEDANGATQFWYYTATNEIYTANIGYRIDLDQATRSSILVEEIINTLGITDTVLREDSIVYQYSDENLTLSDVDWVIFRLLYDPAIQCGMDAESCRAIIETLYY